ncbi:MAG: DM13 domain-containing protein [Pseudomonadota bacterium]
MNKLIATLGAVVIALTMATFGAGDAFADGHARSGTFTGDSNHVTTGGVEVVKGDDGWEIILKSDFTFDGAPDPRVGFGNGGKFVDPTDFEELRANSGEQVYKVPAEIDPESFDTVVIWCRKFSVPLGHALLN